MKWFFCFLGIFPSLLVALSLEEMSLDEKIATLFVIPISPKRGEDHLRDVANMFTHYQIRNVILKAANRNEQKEMLRWIEEDLGYRPFCMMDAEWGLGMRMDGEISYPRNLTLGAIQDDALIYEMAKEIGYQMKEVGGHVNFAPVADMNLNPLNPIIDMRSFGTSPEKVARKVVAFVTGLQETGIYATAKHFPGHGNVSVDSHYALPITPVLEEELIPFQAAIDGGVRFVMTGHLLAPHLTEEPDLPCPMSYNVVTRLLKEQMGFEGIVISDAMNMKAIDDHYSPAEAAVAFLKAGHDLLLYGSHIDEQVDRILRESVPEAIKGVKEALLRGELKMEQIDRSVLKILKAREEAYNSLSKRLFQSAVSVLSKKGLSFLEGKIDYHQVGENQRFQKALAPKIGSADECEVALFAIFNTSLSKQQQYGLSDTLLKEIEEMAKIKKTVVIWFGTPYASSLFSDRVDLIIGYENHPDAIDALIELLFNASCM